MSTANRNGARSGGAVPLSVTQLAELGWHVPYRKTRMRVENCINVPTLTRRNRHQRLVTRLPPRAYVLPSLLETPPQFIRHLLIQTVQRVAVHVVPHLWLVNIACPSLLRIPKHLICHLPNKKWLPNCLRRS